MKANRTYRFWRSAAECLLASIVVAILTFVGFWLRVNLTIACLLYLTLVVLLSITDAIVPSIFVAVISALCLDYFFTLPLFSLQIGDPLNVIALVVFLGTALLITRLMSQRKRAEEALQKLLGELESKVQQRTAELARANDELRGEIGERLRAEEALQKAQAELAHVSRVMTLGELTASIAHEVNQPLAAVVTNGQAGLRWLDLETPRLDRVRAAVERIIRDGNRASEVIQRIRALAKKNPTLMVSLDINDVIREAILLVQREVSIQSQPHETREVLVAVRDSGVGLDAESADRLFNAFFTTKTSGMGMGLSISRSIIMAHGGRLWASPNADHGAAFQFTVPIEAKA